MTWWTTPAWLDLELRRYLIACAGEVNTMGDNRTQQERLHDRIKPTGHGQQRDAQKQGQPGAPKR